MTTSKLPITAILTVATAVAHTMRLAEAAFDKDASVLDKLKLAGDAVALLRDYGNVDFVNALPQFKDMDAEEASIVAAHFSKELDLKHDNVEVAIETGNAILMQAVPAVLGLREAWDRYRTAKAA